MGPWACPRQSLVLGWGATPVPAWFGHLPAASAQAENTPGGYNVEGAAGIPRTRHVGVGTAPYDEGVSKVSTSGSTTLGVRTLTTAGLGVVVAALVLGIVGMHGLSQHGVVSDDTLPVAAMNVEPHASHPAPDHAPIAVEAGASPTKVGIGPPPDDHGSDGDMVMLCVAMLLAVAVTVLLRVRLARVAHRTPLGLRPLFRVPTFPATTRAGTGPPAVWEFSVVRC